MRTQTVVIAERFRGPPRSANGGYACGVIAAPLGGDVTVRLSAPPPLDAELELQTANGETRLLHGDTLLGTGRSGHLDLVPPAPPTFAEAESASRGYVGHTVHPFPTCFVCGPVRPDGLRIFPGPVAGRDIIASPWIPDPSLGDGSGAIDRIYLWSALDCSGAFAVLPDSSDQAIVLGELTARIRAPITAGEHCVVIGWALGGEGRKRYAGSAVFAEDGSEVAAARATWIEVPLAAFSG
jgi:hypothetical protein